MADVTGNKFKDGSSDCEIIKDITVGNATITVTHSLGTTPDEVVVVNKVAYHCIPSLPTADNISLTSTNASAACDVIVKKHMLSGDITETTA
jgi:hypothetical protein